ncbi:MAG: PQQ-dependent sugar dehydrogenase [Planctomycetota bacterium]|nr:PQQ-dependent sugar dehydrogenase [Planctomycetota bacterium]
MRAPNRTHQQHALRALAAALLLPLTIACGGGGGPGAPAITSVTYLIAAPFYRVGAAITPNTATATGATPTQWSVLPALPQGLQLDAATGTISGTPAVPASTTAHTVTASAGASQATADVTVQIGAALPAAFEALADGFDAEVVVEPGLPVPAKIAKFARTPDGRFLYLEVDTGNVRVFVPGVGPGTGLLPTPFVSLTVLQGGHMGLLGLTLAPDFAVSGHVYVLACTPGDAMAMTLDRIRVLRYTDTANVGTNETVVIDDLPVAPPGGINNGGETLFDNAGRLFVSLGDVQVPANSQAPSATSLAGKVLRYDVSTIPAIPAVGNPTAADPEWCRGLRNTFGLAVHPTTGGLFGVDNGPAADDELNFLQPGLNFGWGGTPPPPLTGFRIINYQTVIVPTALCWHDGTGWGAAFANNLFMASYDDHVIRRFEMSGAAFTDVDSETEFARFVLAASTNHPLDTCTGPDGSLYISTFSGIYRITKVP